MAIVRPPQERPTRAWVPAADVYLTDGRALFRVLGNTAVDGQAVIELEDCASLVTLVVTEAELATLRPVRSGHDEESATF